MSRFLNLFPPCALGLAGIISAFAGEAAGAAAYLTGAIIAMELMRIRTGQ